MPELPEVETIRRGLERLVVGYRMSDIEVRYDKVFSGNPSVILNQEIIAVRRFGKGLLIDFANEYSLAIHVKMTGQLIFKSQKTFAEFHPKLPLPLQIPNKHTHIIFKLSAKNGEEAMLYYNDIRKFGWLKLIRTQDAPNLSFFKSLGREPLRDLDLATFARLLSKSQAPVKSLLMDQSKIAGVGNIYANDALFLAKIDPRRIARSVTREESKQLLSAIEEVLQKGIEAGGASDVNYLNAEGKKGGYQNYFLVYKQAGKPCQRCGEPIERIKLAGRGTFYCPKCQH